MDVRNYRYMKFDHPALVEFLQRAYSAEKAAAFAYIGHANSLKKPEDKAAVKQIEDDEWDIVKTFWSFYQKYGIPISKVLRGQNLTLSEESSQRVAMSLAGSCPIFLPGDWRAATFANTSS